MTEALLIMCIMYAILIIASIVLRNNVKFVMLFSVVSVAVGLLIAGFQLDTRALEGLSGYLDAIFYALTGAAFMAVLHGNGTLRWIFSRIAAIQNGLVKSLLLTLFIAIPGMVSGMATVSLITAGAIAGEYLIKNGMPARKATAYVATASIAGMLLPPFSLIPMVFLSNSFAGLTLPLLALGLPMLLVVALVFAKPVATASSMPVDSSEVPGHFPCVIPLIAALVLYLCYDIGKAFLPFLGLPLIAALACVLAVILPAGKRGNPITQIGDLFVKIAPFIAAVVLLGMVRATASRCGVFGALTAVTYDMNKGLTGVIAFVVMAAVGIFSGWYPFMALSAVAFSFSANGSSIGVALAYTALMALVMLFSRKNNFFDQTFAVLSQGDEAQKSTDNLKAAWIPALALAALFAIFYFASSMITGLRI